MAYVIERTFVRPDTSTAWPWDTFPVDNSTQITAKRDSHGVSITDHPDSADGLSTRYTESCASYDVYSQYYDEVHPFWISGGLLTEQNLSDISSTGTTSTGNGVTVSISVLENT